MELTTYHQQEFAANTTRYWIGTDTQSAFIENIKDPLRKQQLEKYGFLDDNNVVSYRFNGAGFRSKDFNDQASVIALGCSYTMGTGLHLENVWPSIVEKQLKMPVWNLGVGGASMDTCFRMLYHYIQKLNAQVVLVLGPPNHRFEIHTDGGVECLMPLKMLHPMQEHWYKNDTNSTLNYYKNSLAIQQLCQQHGKKCVIGYSLELLWKKNPSDPWPGARDMMHAGEQEQRSCAGYFLKSL